MCPRLDGVEAGGRAKRHGSCSFWLLVPFPSPGDCGGFSSGVPTSGLGAHMPRRRHGGSHRTVPLLRETSRRTCNLQSQGHSVETRLHSTALP